MGTTLLSTTTAVVPTRTRTDYGALRDRLRPLRNELQQLLREIAADPLLGDTHLHLQRAELALISARDASHCGEPIPYRAPEADL